jgi:hypothetical protein
MGSLRQFSRPALATMAWNIDSPLKTVDSGRRGGLGEGTDACLPGDCTGVREAPPIAIEWVGGALHPTDASAAINNKDLKTIPFTYTCGISEESTQFPNFFDRRAAMRT